METILRKELKQWQREFRTKHGREPTKRDIQRHPEIASTYDTWNAITAGSAAPSSKSSKSAPVASSLSSSSSLPRPRPSSSDLVAGSSSGSSPARHSTATSRKDHAQRRRDDPAAPRSKRRKDDEADAHNRPPTGPQTPSIPDSSISKTPTKATRHSSSALSTPTTTRGNAFRTPSQSAKAGSFAASLRTPQDQRTGAKGNPEQHQHPPPSPTGSVVDVQMTPTKPTPGSSDRYDYATSPSKLRTLVASHSTRSPHNRGASTTAATTRTDAAELVAYTPQTKARKRLRGEEVPPTPKQQRQKDGRTAKRGTGAVFAAYLSATGSSESEADGAPSDTATGKRRMVAGGRASGGLAAYGFGSLGKPSSAAAFGPDGQKRPSLGSALGVGADTSPLKPKQRLANGVSGKVRIIEDDEDQDDDDDVDPADADPLMASPSKSARASLASKGRASAGDTDDKSPSSRSLARSASTGFRTFRPLFASPSGSHAAVQLGDETRAHLRSGAGGGLFAAELAARQTKKAGEAAPTARVRDNDGESSGSEQNDIDDGRALSGADSARQVSGSSRTLGHPSSPMTGITTPSLVDNSLVVELDPAAVHSVEARRRARQPSWKVSTIVLSEDEDGDEAGDGMEETDLRAAKTITVLPYQRYGSLRHKVASLNRTSSHGDAKMLNAELLGGVENDDDDNDDDEDDDGDDDIFAYTLQHSPRKDALLQPHAAQGGRSSSSSVTVPDDFAPDAGSGQDNDSDPHSSSEDATQRLLLSTLSLNSPRRRGRHGASTSSGTSLHIQGRALLHAQRLKDTKHIEALLGAGRGEMEILSVEDEMQHEVGSREAEKKAVKNWGEAKSRAEPEGMTGKGKAKGIGRPKNLGAAITVPEPERRKIAFSRAGRSGVADDEDARTADRVLRGLFGSDEEQEEGANQTTRSRGQRGYAAEESDDDWASEVESDEYGLGDGRMDELDVV